MDSLICLRSVVWCGFLWTSQFKGLCCFSLLRFINFNLLSTVFTGHTVIYNHLKASFSRSSNSLFNRPSSTVQFRSLSLSLCGKFLINGYKLSLKYQNYGPTSSSNFGILKDKRPKCFDFKLWSFLKSAFVLDNFKEISLSNWMKRVV